MRSTHQRDPWRWAGSPSIATRRTSSRRWSSRAQVGREDIIPRALAHFRAADEDCGSRTANFVQQKRRAR
ncbi:hypothetical protein D7V77_20770 [Corallococcus sp. CA041A]|nr:hypothetical protein D7V77_20770 [Corallococcus sp. CA041A]